MINKHAAVLGLVALVACQSAPSGATNSRGYSIARRAKDGMPMVLVPAGEFIVQFGATQTHQLWYLPNFYMDAHEVTNRQFLTFLESAPPGNYTTDACAIRKITHWIVSASALDLPAVGITEEGARAYAKWVGGELPSLAHFEKAAWGSSMKRNAPQSRSIDESKLSPAAGVVEDGRYGLRGIFGNAAEMCVEEYRADSSAVIVMGGSFNTKTIEMGTPSGDEIGTGSVGFRCVIEAPIAPSFRMEYRRDLWEAIDEAHRRNALVFVSLHYDGCGNCDRHRAKNWLDSGFSHYVNENMVAVVGHTNAAKDLMDAHHSLPNGQCWVYTGLSCADHENVFNRCPAPIFNFRMSPGLYLLNPHLSEVPSAQEMVLTDDGSVPDEGDPVFWVKKFKEVQAKLGTPMPLSEYRDQEKAFTVLVAQFQEGTPHLEEFRKIAGDSKAAFRDEARAIVEEFAKPGGWDPAPDALQKAESHWSRQEFAAALAELRSIKKTQQVLKVRSLFRWIDRVAWERLTLARGFATLYKQPENAKAEYRAVIEHFPGTSAQKAAQSELEALK